MRERYADECALCKSLIYVEQSGIIFAENFCATCRIAIALENISELLEVALDEHHR